MSQFVDLTLYEAALSAGETILTPGLRLARQIESAYLQRALAEQSVIEPPVVTAVDAWLEREWLEAVERGFLPQKRLLSGLQEQHLWRQVVEQHLQQQGTFQLLQPKAAAALAKSARQLLQSYADSPEQPRWRQFWQQHSDGEAFLVWLKRFESRLEAGNYVTRQDAYRALLSVERAQRPRLHLAFGQELPPLTRRALEHCAVVHEIAPMVDKMLPLPGHQYVDRLTELRAIAAWAAQRHRAGRGTTAVVLLDTQRDRVDFEYLLREQLDCLDARYASLPVNFSTGMPLLKTPMYRDAMLALRVEHDQLSRMEVLSLLRSPYVINWPEGAANVQRVRLADAVMNAGVEQFSRQQLAHLTQRIAPDSQFNAILRELGSGSRRERKDLLPTHAIEIGAKLRLWGWPAREALDSLEFQQFNKFEASLDLLMGLSDLEGPITFSEALSRWGICLEDMIFQPQTENSAVQVLGPLEIMGLSFDAVHICGANVGAFPGPPQHSPLLPAALEHALGLPARTTAQCTQEAGRRLRHWQATHGEISASCFRTDDGVDYLPSPLLVLQDGDIQPMLNSQQWRPAIGMESIADMTVPPIAGSTDVAGGAGVLRDFSQCPFKAWLRHRIGPASAGDVVLGLSALERGNLVHWALELIWSQLGSQAELLAQSESARSACIEAAVDVAIQTLIQRSSQSGFSVLVRVGAQCLELERIRLSGLLTDWLALEQLRAVPFTVVKQEQSATLELEGITLSLRPDRVDQLADGQRVVLDYKTGTARVSSCLGERPSDPQLPLYSLLDVEVTGLAFANLKAGSLGFSALGEGLGLNPGGADKPLNKQVGLPDVDRWSDLRDLWLSNLRQLANGFVEGEAQIDPQPSACQFCEYDSVCRRAEWLDNAGEAGSEAPDSDVSGREAS